MKILILGNDYSTIKFANALKNNNCVYSMIENSPNYFKYQSVENTIDFIKEKEINLVIITEEEFINEGLQEILTNIGVSVFAPSIEAIAITTSKTYAKRFMHKNKILTPKFQVIEKPLMAFDYINSVNLPQVIRPDIRNFRECSLFCETKVQAQKLIDEFFNNGNKKIVIEDYIEGKNVSFWTLTDGYNAKIIGTSAKYQNNIAEFEPKFLTNEIKEKIYNEIIIPTIQALNMEDEEYVGILGFDIIISKENETYLIGYNSFFDDINIDFFVENYEFNWAEVFESVLIGDVFSKYEFNSRKNKLMYTIRENEEINFISAKTKTNLNLLIDELTCEKKEFLEAQKIWKS